MALVAPTGMALIRGFLPDILQHKVCGRQCRSCKRFYLFEIISIKTEVKWKLGRACFHSYQAADILIENNNDNNNNDNNQLHTYIHTYIHILYLSSKFSVAVELISLRKKLKWNKNMLSYNFNIIYKLYTTKS